MHPLSTAAATSFLSTLLLFLHLTTSFSMSNLSNFNQTFSCGALTDITGGQRPPYCGPPEFRLTGDGDKVTTLIVKSLPYRVTRVDQTSQTLRLSRLDFYDDLPCTHLSNSTTFDNGIFSLVSNNETLSLFYGCKNIGDYVEEKFKFFCGMPGDLEEGFFRVGDHPSVDWCRTSFQVPFLRSRAQQLQAEGSSLLVEVLKEGFDVSYRNPYGADCQKCYQHSGRQCGFDDKPICICNDQLCPGTGASRFCKGLKIAIAISTTVATIIAFSIIAIAMTFKLKNLQNVDKFEKILMDHHRLTPSCYSYSDIKKITNSFTNILGQGGFGNVYKGKLTDGRLVAVKVLKDSKSDGEEFMNEVASISRTSHVNIVTLLGFCYEKTKRALIYEFMTKGSLDKFISYEGTPDTNFGLEWERFYEIAVGIARGLEYLHRGCNTRIVHFDIKPHNILLDEDFVPKIFDFGLAKLCKSKESKVSMIGARGTVGYIAPEVFCRNFGGISYKSDVYSYGMMALEMVGKGKGFYTGSSKTSEMYFPD
ncbi:LEAF RUST 10 DISEASE-RESISTANCE LOCUS RECEPTOR-LIKE PROTEIN KINASE-like 2.4 [Populus nigra]|uniref:LEAF RUST 10 DISEASE-RESISTANCE LOCUS RECEPTOR-LIKE PROTEIN KINASE-like 2.4 n=1 Tax=Populus nigra TaxID=3691 RepID=UPI002B2783F5|nr:LEAF RUST 10 DISEASE-RESISTANCE LOCUS RECEPTOR-LIKE PROTEIN KINASE-like 2.4 [Populus nigra]